MSDPKFRYQVPTLSSGARVARPFKNYSSAVRFAIQQAQLLQASSPSAGDTWNIERYGRRHSVVLYVTAAGIVRAKTFLPVTVEHPEVIFGGSLKCRECGYAEFRYMGRSLDYHDYQCLGCGESASTLTETGASR